jgi:hypothetical protein
MKVRILGCWLSALINFTHKSAAEEAVNTMAAVSVSKSLLLKTFGGGVSEFQMHEKCC